MFRVSLANLTATAILTGNLASLAYPPANAASPERPFQPYKTTATGDSFGQPLFLLVDFGAPVTLGVVALLRTNFTAVVIQGNATDAWGTPSYTQNVTVARNPISSRYHHAHAIVGGFTYRYLRIEFPSQTPEDGALGLILGGVWAGLWTAPPRGLRMGYHVERLEPVLDQRTLSQALHRLRLGEPRAHVMGTRQAFLGTPPPGHNDELSAWAEFDRQMADADIALTQLEPADPAQAWVMRRIAHPDWTVVDATLAESPFELEEVIAGGGIAG